jgi:hypothetical protein
MAKQHSKKVTSTVGADEETTETPDTTVETAPHDDSPAASEPETSEQPAAFHIDANGLSDRDLNSALVLLRGEARRRLEEKQSSRPSVGSRVRILRGPPKYIGKVGTAVIVRKSRCFVTVPEINSPAYVLIADVELLP